MAQPEILISPRTSAISAKGGVIEVLVCVKAPDQLEPAPGEVHAKRLALVVDRSASMAGKPLEEALRCVEYIAKCLTPVDEIAVVAYDSRVNVLVPLGPVKSVEAICQVITAINSGGATDLLAGWKAGAWALEGGVAPGSSRVILLSDGQVNHGVCDVWEIERHCNDLLARGVSTTTVGLGREINKDLMIAMALAGGGKHYHGQSADDLFASFDEEIQLLQAPCLRKVDIKLIPGPGVTIEPISLVRHNLDGSYHVGDLAWGAQSQLLLRLHVSPGTADTTRDLLACLLSARTLSGASVSAYAPGLILPVVDEMAFANLSADPAVDRCLTANHTPTLQLIA